MGGSERGVVRFGCPSCGARLKTHERPGGGRLRCPECGESVPVPAVEVEHEELEPALRDESADVWIPIECRVCHTRMDARVNQVGQKIACPDCNTLATVPPPPPRPKKVTLTAPKETIGVEAFTVAPRDVPTGPTTQVVCPHCGHRQTLGVDQLGRKQSCAGCFMIFVAASPPPSASAHPDDDGELRLSAPTPRHKPTLPDFDLDVEEEARSAPAEPFASRPELLRPLGPRPVLPEWPLVSGVFGFPLRSGVWQRWVSSSLGLSAVAILVSNAHAATRGGPGKEWALAVLYSGLAVFGAGLWYIFCPATLLAIFQDTAAGNDEIESWPDGPWIDSAFEGLYLVCALASAGVVSAGLWEGLKLVGLDLRIALSLAGAVAFVSFPVFLLSMIEQGSMLMPVSGPVWGSVLSGWRWWALFLVESLALDFVFGFAIRALLSLLPSAGPLHMLALAISSTLFVAFLIIYFRLLGRLAWCCEEVIALHATDEDDSPRLNDLRAVPPAPLPAAPLPATTAPDRPRYIGPSDDDDDFLSGI